MSGSSHPYARLPGNAFWKTSVAELDPRQIDLAWKPKAAINRATKFITVGSCFAQHISKSLKSNGFNWVDAEPAPDQLSRESHSRMGYGVFSFRTGNIYSAALLKQWIGWATGRERPSTEVWVEDGRYFDPFRPSIPVDGYSSVEEMTEARQATLSAILDATREADLFIFTLGLTEAWRNGDGAVYPMCPGTIRGVFSPENHYFHNYDEEEIVRDLAATFDELRGINPELRFLLTVSPVPLTATASGEHVLTATTYSKSALRSAAGFLAKSRVDTDYFPSYELITAPAFGGRFYEQNMRSVSPDGVAFVMGQFFRAIEGVPVSAAGEASSRPRSIVSGVSGETTSARDICDEIILETWSGRAADDSGESPNIVLVGDSQFGMISKVLEEQQIRHAGGGIMNRSDWHAVKFELDEEWMFRPNDPGQRVRWESTYQASFARPAPSSGKRWVITNVGMQTSLAVSDHGLFHYVGLMNKGRPAEEITGHDLQNYVLAARRVHLGLLCKFLSKGYSVVVISDPPTEPYYPELFVAIDAMLGDLYKSVGCSVFSAREWINAKGGMPAEYRSQEIDPFTSQIDWVHGSAEYYRQLVKEVFARFAISPQYRKDDSASAQVLEERLPRPDGAGAAAGVGTFMSSEPAVPSKLGSTSSTDEICDDIILETWSGRPAFDPDDPPNILLIGDSQMGMMADALDVRGVRYGGGAIMNGSEWHASMFTTSEGYPFFAPLGAGAKARWESACSAVLSRYRGTDSQQLWIITNVGFHSSAFFTLEGIIGYYNAVYGKNLGISEPCPLSSVDIVNYLRRTRKPHMALLRNLVKAGYRVVWVGDPPVNPGNEQGAALIETLLVESLEENGCSIFDAREWIRKIGGMRDDLVSDEVFPGTQKKLLAHGSDEYYRLLVEELLGRFPIQPKYRNAG